MRKTFLGTVAFAATFALGSSASAAVAWTVNTSVDPSTTTNTLSAVSARSASDAWAVGTFKTTDRHATFDMATEHWDGTRWNQVTTPQIAATDEKLLAVSGSGASDVWAVGSQAPATSQNLTPLAAHWDGNAWTIVPTPATPSGGEHALLAGVTALSPTNAWAVGVGRDSRALVEHWDGTAWSLTQVPVPPAPAGSTISSSFLTGVAATSASDIWAVGGFTETSGTTRQNGTLLLHFNGSGWQVVAAPTSAAPLQLNGVAAVAPNDAWAVGDVLSTDGSGQAARTVILHWNGTAWSTVSSPSPNSNALLSSVAAASSTDVWAVGRSTQRVTDSEVHGLSLIEHWDGTSWSVVPTPAIPDADHQLQGVTATPTAGFAVGQRLSPGVTRTLILGH